MSESIARLRERWKATKVVLRAPRVRVEVYGTGETRDIFRHFTARHPRIKIAANKRWGVALMALPATFDEYINGRHRKAVRQNRRRAEEAGYRYATVSPDGFLDDILEVNRSAPSRQGREMREAYVDADQVRATFARLSVIHAVIDSQGRLRAYAVIRIFGDVFLLTMLIGHADALEHGVMYLLVSELVRECIADRRDDGSPHWLMADTFWGASRGLAYFKERVGFTPFRVEWVWVDRLPGTPEPST